MAEPLVDVGMPAHGAPDYLAEAVGSVLAQSHARLRLLVLDDSGTDQIGDALEPFRDDPRLDHRRAPPMTAMTAMTTLMGDGDGAYFAFLHDDDRWGPDFLRRRIEFLEAHPECGFVFSGHIDIDAAGRETGRFAAPCPEGVVPRDWLLEEMQRRNVVDTMHSVLTRRSALVEAGAHLDERFPRLFDWELWLRLAARFPVGCVDEEDAEYRAHEQQMSARPGQAADFVQMVRHADEVVAAAAPALRLGASERRRLSAGLEVSVALDCLEAGDVRAARVALREALRASPRAALNRRFVAAAAGVAGGRRARAWVGRRRAREYQRTAERRRGQRPR